MELGVGLRVVRGPDWKWANQDDGEGHCGTVVEIGKPGSQTTPNKTVVVQWDSGSRTNYRIGYQNAFDLRIFDNAPIGIRHSNITCSYCKKHGISGMRWKCTACQNVDLCTICYMSDKHDNDHPFVRIESPSSIGIEVPKRSLKNAVKIQARGIFSGARVVRGCDWDWANQDGGEGKIGKVIDIRGWDNESRRSVANVMWASGSTNVYRLGHKGKVDLKYVVDAPGYFYYRDHLPVLGQTDPLPKPGGHASSSCLTNSGGSNSHSLFNVGDKVQVVVADVNELKALQEGHGGWSQRMAEFIGQIGTVHRVTDRRDIRVQFEGCQNRWTFNPAALNKVIFYSIGDTVKICDEVNKVKQLQKSHGEWIEQMRSCLGRTGKVVKVYSDGDLRVTVDGQTWTFNPACVALITTSSSNDHDSAPSPTVEESTSDRENTSSTPSYEVNAHVTTEIEDDKPVQQPDCIICNETFASVVFEPCGHQICCNECCSRMKKCVQCSETIVNKASSKSDKETTPPTTKGKNQQSTGMNSFSNTKNKINVERLHYLESKIAEYEEANNCTICMEKIRNVVFLCGHGACADCAQTLKICHMCRKSITMKINLY